MFLPQFRMQFKLLLLTTFTVLTKACRRNFLCNKGHMEILSPKDNFPITTPRRTFPANFKDEWSITRICGHFVMSFHSRIFHITCGKKEYPLILVFYIFVANCTTILDKHSKLRIFSRFSCTFLSTTNKIIIIFILNNNSVAHPQSCLQFQHFHFRFRLLRTGTRVQHISSRQWRS